MELRVTCIVSVTLHIPKAVVMAEEMAQQARVLAV